MIAALFDRDGCFLVLSALAARRRSRSARVRPAPNAPIWRKSRRETLSQNVRDAPRNRNMVRLQFRDPDKGRWETAALPAFFGRGHREKGDGWWDSNCRRQLIG